VEAVLRARINVDLDVGPLGLDRLDIDKRNARILFAEMITTMAALGAVAGSAR
jgi:hypothetical protein